MTNKYVLDTSALTAFMDSEPGEDFIENLLDNQPRFVVIPWVALYEIYYTTRRKHGEKEAENRYTMIKELPVQFIWQMSERGILIAAKLKANYPLSVADSFVASIAIEEKAILVHKDPEMEALNGKIQMEILPYKK